MRNGERGIRIEVFLFLFGFGPTYARGMLLIMFNEGTWLGLGSHHIHRLESHGIAWALGVGRHFTLAFGIANSS